MLWRFDSPPARNNSIKGHGSPDSGPAYPACQVNSSTRVTWQILRLSKSNVPDLLCAAGGEPARLARLGSYMSVWFHFATGFADLQPSSVFSSFLFLSQSFRLTIRPRHFYCSPRGAKVARYATRRATWSERLRPKFRPCTHVPEARAFACDDDVVGKPHTSWAQNRIKCKSVDVRRHDRRQHRLHFEKSKCPRSRSLNGTVKRHEQRQAVWLLPSI